MRILLAAIGNLTGRTPTGYTGRSNVSPFRPMPVPADFEAVLTEEKRRAALVTRVRGGAIRSRMARLLGILFGIALTLSLAAGGVAHAAEQICLPSTEAIAEGHSEGDADQAPHGDKGQAHHHGTCSGHHVAAPAGGQVVHAAPAPGAAPTAAPTTLGPPVDPHAELRPPIA